MGRSLKKPVYKKPATRGTKKIVKKKKSKTTKKQNNRKHSSKSSSKRRQSRKGTKKKKKTSTTSRGKKRTKKQKGVQEGGYYQTLEEHVKAFKKNLENFKKEYSKKGFDKIKVSINKDKTGIILEYKYMDSKDSIKSKFIYNSRADKFYSKEKKKPPIYVGSSIAEIIYYLADKIFKAEKAKLTHPPVPPRSQGLGGRYGANIQLMRNTMVLPGMEPETRFNSTIYNSLEAKITKKILTESKLELSHNTSDIENFYRICLNVTPLETKVDKKCIILDFDQTITPHKDHGVGSLSFNKTRQIQISETIQSLTYKDKIDEIDAINKEYNSYTTEIYDEIEGLKDEREVLINGHIQNEKYTSYYENLIKFLKECKEKDGYDIIIASNNVLSFIELFLNLLDVEYEHLGFNMVENITIITPSVVNNKFFNNEFFKTNNIRARGCDMMKELVILKKDSITKDIIKISFEDFKAAMYIYIYLYLGYNFSLYIDDTPGNTNMVDIINESKNLNSKTCTVERFGFNKREGGIHIESGDNNEKSTYDEIRKLIRSINESFTKTANFGNNYSHISPNASSVTVSGSEYSALDHDSATTRTGDIQFDSWEPEDLILLKDYLSNVIIKFSTIAFNQKLDATSLKTVGAPFEKLTDKVKIAYKNYHNDPAALTSILPLIDKIKDYNVTEDTINEIFTSWEPEDLILLKDYLSNVIIKFSTIAFNQKLDATSLKTVGAPFEKLTDKVKIAYKNYHNDPAALTSILPLIDKIKDYNVTEDTINEIFTDAVYATPSHVKLQKQKIKRVREIVTSPFYHELNRNDAEKLLESSALGSFVIRPSSQPGYTISVKGVKRVYHYILSLDDGFKVEDKTTLTHTLTKLIKHYGKKYIHKKEKTNLLIGIPKTSTPPPTQQHQQIGPSGIKINELEELLENDMDLLIKNMKTQEGKYYLPYFYENKTDSNPKYYVRLSANKKQFDLQLPDNKYSISVGTKKIVGNNTYDVGKPLLSEEDINSKTFYFYSVKERQYHSINDLIKNEFLTNPKYIRLQPLIEVKTPERQALTRRPTITHKAKLSRPINRDLAMQTRSRALAQGNMSVTQRSNSPLEPEVYASAQEQEQRRGIKQRGNRQASVYGFDTLENARA